MARRKWTLETIGQVLEGEQPFIQVGYTPKIKDRKEGEVWTDARGDTWKKTSYGKVSVNKQMDLIRDLTKRKCSVCGRDIDLGGNKLDFKVFPKTNKCYDCLEVQEFELRVTGKYKDYEDLKVLKNKRGIIKDFREKVTEAIDFLKNDSGKMSEVMSNGEVLTWTGKSNPQWLKDAQEDLVKVNEELVKINKEIEDLESKTICQISQA